jgi:SnoaL-like domain
MGAPADAFVTAYVAEMTGRPSDLDRVVSKPSGLSPEEMIAAFVHPDLGRLGITLMADCMAPEESIYYDAIFGAFHGQHAIRNWLVPAMADIEFIDFVPTGESAVFDDGEGTSSLDEWQMVMNLGDEKVPLSRGVSVRRYRGGWITWACDVYDTAAFRQPPPADAPVLPGMTEPPPPLPPFPRVDWIADTSQTPRPLSAAAAAWVAERTAAHASHSTTSPLVDAPSGLTHVDLHELTHDPVVGYDFDLMSDLFHPTDSVYIDPLFGEFRGQVEIRGWLTDIMPRAGALAFEPLGPALFDGNTSVLEWKQMAVGPDGSRTMMLRGTSVRRYRDGWVVYAADYFDTAPLADPDIQAAGLASGATITAADILKYRQR